MRVRGQEKGPEKERLGGERVQQPYCYALPSVAFLDDSQHSGR